MVDVMELPRSRINASMLAQFIDRPVCFVGRLEKIHPTGKMFILSDGEGKHGTIELLEPTNLYAVYRTCKTQIMKDFFQWVLLNKLLLVEMLDILNVSDFVFQLKRSLDLKLLLKLDEEISGIVEVVGRVTAKATIMCASYIQFKEDNHPFDLGLYNEAVKITHDLPQFFPLGIVQYD